jgi:long-chain acyl-CoA synthetase
MTSFKPAIGHLCLNEGIDVLPMYLGGTYEALPVGSMLPKARDLQVKIGKPLTPEAMRRATEGMPRSKAYRYVAQEAERAVRKLGGLPLELEERDEPEVTEEHAAKES